MVAGEYKAEYLERAVEALLVAGIGDALDVVEAEWAATDAVTLPEPVNWDRGYRTWMLDLPSTSYPYILTIFVNRTPGKIAGLKMQDAEYAGAISIFVVADTEAEVAKIAHRYAQAMISILQSNQVVEGCRQRDWKPEVTILADNATHQKAGVSGDMYNAGDVDYIRLVEIGLVMTEL